MKHAKKYSKSFNAGPWQTETDKMAMKTVLVNMLKTWGPMSIEMQTAYESDDQVITNVSDEGVAEYKDVEVMDEGEFPDAGNIKMADGSTVDTATGEVVSKDAEFTTAELEGK